MGHNTSPDHQHEERFDLSGGSEHHPCVHLAALAPHSSHLQVSHLLHYCFWSTNFPKSSSTILTVCDLILKTFTYSSLLVGTSLDFLLSPNFESSWFFSGGRITPIKMQNHCKIFCYSSSGQSVKLRTYVLEKIDSLEFVQKSEGRTYQVWKELRYFCKSLLLGFAHLSRDALVKHLKTSYGAPEFSVPAPNRYLSRWKILSCNIFLIYRSKTRNRSMCNQRAINVHLFSNSRTIYCFPNFQTCDEFGVHWLAGGARLCDCVKATTPPAAPQSAPTRLSAASMRTKRCLFKVH